MSALEVVLALAFASLPSTTLSSTVTYEHEDHSIRPLAGAVVYAVDAPSARSTRKVRRRAPVEFSCTSSTVRPEVAVIRTGQVVRVTNLHRGLMTVRMQASSGESLLSATLAARGQRTPRVRPEAGRVAVRCGDAVAQVLVLDHDVATQTNAEGFFTIDAAGQTLAVWHPRFGRVEQVSTPTTSVPWPTF